MKEGLYEIVGMRRSPHGKWVFTARPVDSEIQFECESDSMEDEVFKYSREPLWLNLKENRDSTILDRFETVEERRTSEELTRSDSAVVHRWIATVEEESK